MTKHGYVGKKTEPGETDERYTPSQLLDLVYKFSPIALDPCWHPDCAVKASVTFTKEQDGLKQDWEKAIENILGCIWVNMPFSNVRPWMEKAVEHRARNIILLTNASTNTKWFQEIVFPKAARIHFPKKKYKFIGQKHINPWPSMLTYFGPEPERFYEIFSPNGVVLSTSKCDR